MIITLKEYTNKEFKTKKDKNILKKEIQLSRISLRLIELRKQHKLTQKQLAYLLNTEQQYISRLENMESNSFTLNTLNKIAEILSKKLLIDFV